MAPSKEKNVQNKLKSRVTGKWHSRVDETGLEDRRINALGEIKDHNLLIVRGAVEGRVKEEKKERMIG